MPHDPRTVEKASSILYVPQFCGKLPSKVFFLKMENLSQRKCLDIILVVLLSVIAISQVYESCIKFVKRQTTQSVSFQDTDIVFPSMTICDKNGFKSIDVMEAANMSNFRLMTKVNTTSGIRISLFGTPISGKPQQRLL